MTKSFPAVCPVLMYSCVFLSYSSMLVKQEYLFHYWHSCCCFGRLQECIIKSNFLHVYLIRDSQRSRMTFSTPASTSPTTRQILSTPTPEQLSLSDTWSNKKSASTLLSDSTGPVLPRGEQLFTQEHDPHCKIKMTGFLNCPALFL